MRDPCCSDYKVVLIKALSWRRRNYMALYWVILHEKLATECGFWWTQLGPLSPDQL
jgi:hypothetical protein